jgi:hypothetical protein
MLPTQLLSILHKPRCVCVRGTRLSPRAKDWAPHCVGDGSEIKSLGRPPAGFWLPLLLVVSVVGFVFVEV